MVLSKFVPQAIGFSAITAMSTISISVSVKMALILPGCDAPFAGPVLQTGPAFFMQKPGKLLLPLGFTQTLQTLEGQLYKGSLYWVLFLKRTDTRIGD